MNTITVDVTLTQISCGGCGGTYAINESYRALKAREGTSWNCPYCQIGWGYSGNENDRLKKELAAKEKSIVAMRAEHDQTKAYAAELRQRKDKLDRRNTALRGVVTRTRNKFSKGQCPCCREEFQNLKSHMANQHLEFVAVNAKGEK